MCAFRVYTSNRLETLLDMLSSVLESPLSSPIDPEIIVVQSKGMEHWVSLELAGRHGICANVEFPFPNRFLQEIDRRLTGVTLSSSFEPRRLTGRILRLLHEVTERPEFGEVREYLKGDDRGLRHFQLAERLADTLDQYLVYRPEMIARWERGREEGWQASLWRELIRELPREGHRAARAEGLVRALESPDAARALPERVSVFGISALPRFHMDILAAVSRSVTVNLFIMNPCREYWSDIVSDRDLHRTALSSPDGIEPADLHLDKGHSLLASTGMMGKDFFDLIHDYPVEEQEHFVDPGEATLLSALQADILHLRDREGPTEKKALPDEDVSIRIHSCHSPLREVEVLRDRILEMFERYPGLEPADILVTMPDVESYAPFIRAVFDAQPNDTDRIPYSIADQSVGSEGRLIKAFMSTLELGRERFVLSRVMALLESPSIQRRFLLSEKDLEVIRTWAVRTGIRWGLDGKDRSASGLPPFEENTWSAGVKRLLLGYAMTGRDRNTFAGILPFDHVEAGSADTLGRLLAFTSAAHELLTQLELPRTPHAWAQVLDRILSRFFDPDEDTEREAATLRRALGDLGEAFHPTGSDEGPNLHLDAVQWFLGRRFECEGFGSGFMSGGVTFCAMLPMRSIPFRVICCLGLNGDAFPRNTRTPEFDLMAKKPRAGDRSRRTDDRYLFLETILSARDHLHLSHVGQSLLDNSAIPPSPLVAELLEIIQRGFETTDEPILDKIVVRHPLQPFNPEYFIERGSRVSSYSHENLLAAEALVGDQASLSPFFPGDLSEPGPEWNKVDIEDLIRFFRNPSEFILRRRLGVVLEKPESLPEDSEPFSIDGLQRYMLGRDLVERFLKGETPFNAYETAAASGALPHGTAGKVLFDELAGEAALLAEQAGAFFGTGPVETATLDMELGEFRLTGPISFSPSSGMVHYRFASLKVKDLLNGWILHLAVNAAAIVPPEARKSVIIGLGSRNTKSRWRSVWFAPLDDAASILKELLILYREGLRRPLPFFPESSWAYAHTMRQGGVNSARQAATLKARQAWEETRFARGEKSDPYINLCFRGRDPIDTEAFRTASLEILDPVIEYQRAPAWRP